MDKVVAIIVAGGAGLRAGSGMPKQFVPIAGKPMLAHAYDALARHPAVVETIVVVPAGSEERVADLLGGALVTAGGASRRASTD